MRIYILEDDLSVISILEDIIERCNLGTVCGTNEGQRVSVTEILAKAPDIVLVDFLMPGKDGIQVVRELREQGLAAKIIMISQVSSKDLIAKAYLAGVDFFISKPINLIEVRQVIGNVTQQLENERALQTIQSVFTARQKEPAAPPPDQEEQFRRTIQYHLSQLGMAGEKGTEDILEMCVFLESRKEKASTFGVGALCAQLSDSPKSMEQRVRRTVERGLSHMASLGMDDYCSESFSRYATVLFSFQEVRAEMDRMRGIGRGGRVNLKKFLDGLLLIAEE